VSKSNPFQTTMVRMQMPPGSGSFSARGFEVFPDKDGVIEVPADMVDDAKSHGMTEAAPKEGKK
jgi:hypothetical protein